MNVWSLCLLEVSFDELVSSKQDRAGSLGGSRSFPISFKFLTFITRPSFCILDPLTDMIAAADFEAAGACTRVTAGGWCDCACLCNTSGPLSVCGNMFSYRCSWELDQLQLGPFMQEPI